MDESDSDNELVSKLDHTKSGKKQARERNKSEGEEKVYLKKFRERIENE